mgnify:CR=1 FL=1|jgi:hypothetical protein
MLEAIEGAFDEMWIKCSLAVYDTKNTIQQIKKIIDQYMRIATIGIKKLHVVGYFVETG